MTGVTWIALGMILCLALGAGAAYRVCSVVSGGC